MKIIYYVLFFSNLLIKFFINLENEDCFDENGEKFKIDEKKALSNNECLICKCKSNGILECKNHTNCNFLLCDNEISSDIKCCQKLNCHWSFNTTNKSGFDHSKLLPGLTYICVLLIVIILLTALYCYKEIRTVAQRPRPSYRLYFERLRERLDRTPI